MSGSGGYAVEYLPAAKRDLVEIVSYVSNDLGSPGSARTLAKKLVDGIESLSSLPYRRPVFVPMRPLAHEFRSLRIANYLVFYWVDEPTRTVTVARVLYARADSEKTLN